MVDIHYAGIKGVGLKGLALENPYVSAGTAATVVRMGLYRAGNSTGSDGILGINLTAIGTASATESTAEGKIEQFATTASANANAGLRQTSAHFRREWRSYIIGRCGFSSTSDIRVFIGWTSDANEIAGETTLNNLSGCGIGKRAGDTNWFTYTNDGDATEDRVDTGITFATNFTTFELELDSTSFRSKIGTAQKTQELLQNYQQHQPIYIFTGK